MSLHREVNFCGHEDQSGGRYVYWVGACDCGWQGERHRSSGSTGADGARADYRSHVEEALGAEAYYDTNVRCRNCGSEHQQGILVGTHVMSGSCIRCGMRMLEPDNESWDDHRQRMRGLFG